LFSIVGSSRPRTILGNLPPSTLWGIESHKRGKVAETAGHTESATNAENAADKNKSAEAKALSSSHPQNLRDKGTSHKDAATRGRMGDIYPIYWELSIGNMMMAWGWNGSAYRDGYRNHRRHLKNR
jgi:hypothetical protein